MTDTITELTRFRADLTRALARRGERLLELDNPGPAVAALEPLEAYFITRELGLDQARPLIMHLTDEQLHSCVDLTCWQSYDFEESALAEWLSAFIEEGPIVLAKVFLRLEPEIQALFLTRTLTIYSCEDDELPSEDDYDDERPRAMTPDSLYLLEMKSDLPLAINPLGLVGALYQYDELEARHLMSLARWEMPSQVEEEALRFRGNRMQELGFVTPDEAAILFTPPGKPSPYRPLEPEECATTRLPALYVQLMMRETSLLVQALAQIADRPWLARVQQELVWTINTGVIAYGEAPRDIEHVAEIAIRVRDTISLGMEKLIREAAPTADSLAPDPLQAAELSKTWSLRDLFRHGYAAALIIHQQVKEALRLPQVASWYQLPDTEQSDEPVDRLERAFVGALLRRHPLAGGYDPAAPDKVQAFARLSDIASAQERLERLVERLTLQTEGR